jgi:hypothetical protein
VLLIKKWFTEIVLDYFPMGHTHEKVDGMLFAKIRKLKKTQKCETPVKFKSFVTKAFKQPKTCLSGIGRHGSHHISVY